MAVGFAVRYWKEAAKEERPRNWFGGLLGGCSIGEEERMDGGVREGYIRGL